MAIQNWLPFNDSNKGREPSVSVVKPERLSRAPGVRAREELIVLYDVGGLWTSEMEGFSVVEVPGTNHETVEGAPQVPTAGLLIALPSSASDVEVKVIEKSTVPVELTAPLAPAPTQFLEEEFRVELAPDAAVYESEHAYPGRDVDLIGVSTVEGVRVARLFIYLAQYSPKQQFLDVVQHLSLELSYVVAPSRAPERAAPRPLATASLIQGLELLPRPREPLIPEAVTHVAEPAERGGVVVPPRAADLDSQEAEEPASADASGPGNEAGEAQTDAPVLKVTSNWAPYIIVTTPALAIAVYPLAVANKPARIALTTQVTAEFPASSLKESIRTFIGWAYANYTPVKPQYVVLAGDTDVIPMHSYQGGYASDNYYVDHTGDLSPEVAIGRIPSSDAATMQSVCAALGAYRGLRLQDGFGRKVLVSAYTGEPYESCSDQIAGKLGAIYDVVKRYAKDTTHDALLGSLNEGVAMAIYRGHGSKTAWSSSNGLTTADMGSLATDTRPPMFLDICCENGWVDDPGVETLAEALIRRKKGVAVFASSRDSWTYPNNDFANYLVDGILTAGLTRPADIAKYAKTRMVIEHPNDQNYADNLEMYNLFGDPAAPVASNVEYMLGLWTMDHDGWQGLLNVTSVSGFKVVKVGTISAPQWTLSGTYTGADGRTVAMQGTIGGVDPNHLGGTPRRSDHRLDLTISFPGAPQQFVGYVHGRSRNVLSGYTWWANIPFGWTARRMHTVLGCPAPLTPTEGTVFSTYPRTTTLTWSAVPGANQYLVEVQYGFQNAWSPLTTATVSSTSFTFTHIGAQPGRWRVSARDSSGKAGVSGATPWRTYRYTV